MAGGSDFRGRVVAEGGYKSQLGRIRSVPITGLQTKDRMKISGRYAKCTSLCFLGLILGCSAARKADNPELSPLMNAAFQNDLPRAHALLEKGADVRQRTDHGETALYEAIERRSPNSDNLPMVEVLLKAGADPNEVEIFDTPALEISLTRDYSNAAVTLLLLHSGARVSTECGKGDSLLSLATQDSNLEVMRTLIDSKAPLNCVSAGGQTALYWAAINGQADRVELLLRSGADQQLADMGGKKPLDVARTTNPDQRVQADFAKTREVLLAQRPSTR